MHMRSMHIIMDIMVRLVFMALSPSFGNVYEVKHTNT